MTAAAICRAGLQLDRLPLHLPTGGVHRHVAADDQAVAPREPPQDLRLHSRRRPHSEAHAPVRDRRERRRPRDPGGLDRLAPVSRLPVALVERRHREVSDGSGIVVEEGEAYVSVAYALVLHLVAEGELEVDGVIVPCRGGIVGCVEGRKVKFLDEEGGLVGAEAQPQEEGGEAGGEHESAAAPCAVAVFRHGRGGGDGGTIEKLNDWGNEYLLQGVSAIVFL